ncbi:MAG: methionine adenosyltransferase [Bradyrhizobium sp.]|nr:methionine adenosyltransferase [Bradyrhizobium sp.]
MSKVLNGKFVFTSESVAEGHPDKLCDQVSDAIVDLFLAEDPEARVACETMATTNRMILAGEVRGPKSVTSERIVEAARSVVKKIGYEQAGFHWQKLVIENLLHEQSEDIAIGVDAGNREEGEGAGDQGLMFGYAVDETPELMPAAIQYANRILLNIRAGRVRGDLPLLGPDAKSQVTLAYEGGQPRTATAVVVSIQHDGAVDASDVREMIRPYVTAALPAGWMPDEAEFHVNPTGRFVKGGPDGDAGLTGRKIIVDTYGGAAPHGGGAFSGKDPTKVDRSAAYMARYLAKNVVAAGLARRCTIQLAYAIGVARPLGVYVDAHGTGQVDEKRLSAMLQDIVSLSPRGIRKHLGLNRPIYARTAAYGHFGRQPEADGGFSWEALDIAKALKAAF